MTDTAKIILLVEDDAIVAGDEASQLKGLGYRVECAFRGEQAVAMVRERPGKFDLILMDIDLGQGMDGAEAARRILQERDVPVVFLSSHTEPEVVEKTEKITSYGYVVKDSGLTVLAASLKMAFKLHRARRELERHEAALHEMSEMFRLFMENNPIYVYIKDKDLRYVHVSRNYEQLLGRPVSEIIGKTMDELFPADFARVVLEDDRRVLQRGPSVGEVVEVLDGRTYSTIKFPIFIGGALKYLAGYSIDITDSLAERARAERSLRESEARYRSLFENSRAVMLTIDPRDGAIVDANPAAERFYGWTRERLRHMRVRDINVLAPVEIQARMDEARAGARDIFYFRHRLADGSVRDVAVYSGPIDFGGRQLLFSIVHDITARTRAEAALRESEKRYRLLAENMKDVVWTLDPETKRFTYISPSVLALRGFTPEEVMAQSVVEAMSPEEASVLMAELPARVARFLADPAGDHSYVNEISQPRKDGSFVRTEVVTRFYRDEETGKLVIHGVTRDITERKRLEEALEKRLIAVTRPVDSTKGLSFEDLFDLSDIQRLQDASAEAWGVAALITRPDGTPITRPSNFTKLCAGIIRNTPIGLRNCNFSDAMIGRHNPSGPNVRTCLSAGLCNAGASIIVGGKHIANWLIGQVRNESQNEDDIMAYAREIGADEQAFREAYRAVPVMSQERFERIACVLYEMANQISTVAYQNLQQARIIHQLKQAEEEVRDSQRKYQALVETLYDWVWEVDALGNYTYISPQIKNILGYEPYEILGKTPYDLMSPEEARQVSRVFSSLIRDRKPIASLENVCLHKDGHPVVLETSGLPFFDEEGNLRGYRGTDRDITMRKKAEQDLKLAVRQKDTLMKELQHRVKNSLAVVSALLGLESERLADDRSRRVFDETRSRIRSIASLYERLYGSSEIDAVDLHTHVRRLAEELFRTYAPRGLRLETRLDEVRLDTKRAVPLGLILNELITNALKYAYPAGTAGEVRVGLERSDEGVTITVTDDGVGLPAGFDPAVSGGMGMNLVRMMVEQIDAVLDVSSGKGTRFSVRFKL